MRITIRQAVVSDIERIHDLIKLYTKEELLLPKSRTQITAILPSFLAADYDGQFAGSVAFKVDGGEKAEIISWVVDRKYFNHGIGSMLISAVMERIENLGIKTVYTLTLRPSTFEKHGFQRVSMNMLPEKVWGDCKDCPRNIAKPGSVECKEVALIKNL